MASRTEARLLDKLISEAVGEWLIDLRLGDRSPKTLRFYRQNIATLVRMGDRPLSEMNPAYIKHYLSSLQDEHNYAHHARFRTIRAFFGWCKKQGYIAESPVTMAAPKVPHKVIPVFSDAELKAINKASEQASTRVRDKAILLTLINTGMRLSELVGICLEDIVIDGYLVTIRGKGNKQRILKLSTSAMKAIVNYVRVRGSNLPNLWLSEEKRPLTTYGMDQAIRRVVRRAGIRGRKASAHVFRHTMATNYLLAGGDPLSLKYILGHSSLTMVEHYSENARARRAIKTMSQLSDIDRLGLR